jgi:hypothetical protein
MWSAPIKCTAPDGSEYNLLLLDSEGIDAYDQTVCLNSLKHFHDNDLYPSRQVPNQGFFVVYIIVGESIT